MFPSEKEITNGNYYILRVTYPVAQDASVYAIVNYDDDKPIDETDMFDDLIDELECECYDSYSYLDENNGPDRCDFETEDEYEQACDEFYDYIREQIDTYFIPINKETLDNYGYDWIRSNCENCIDD